MCRKCTRSSWICSSFYRLILCVKCHCCAIFVVSRPMILCLSCIIIVFLCPLFNPYHPFHFPCIKLFCRISCPLHVLYKHFIWQKIMKMHSFQDLFSLEQQTTLENIVTFLWLSFVKEFCPTKIHSMTGWQWKGSRCPSRESSSQ